MPRGKHGKARGANTIVAVPFRAVTASSNSTTSVNFTSGNEIDLIPANLGSTVSTISGVYEKYRVTSLTVSIHVDTYACAAVAATATAPVGMGLYIGFDNNPSAQTGAISNISDAAQLPVFRMCGAVPHLSLSVGKKYLTKTGQPVQWWDTTATGSPADEFRYQGTVYWARYVNQAPTPATYVWIELQGTIEFCSPVASGDAIARLLKRQVRQDDSKEEDLSYVDSPRFGGLSDAPDWVRSAVAKAAAEQVARRPSLLPPPRP